MSPESPPSDVVGYEILRRLTDPVSDEWTWAVDALGDYFHGPDFSGRRFERLGTGEGEDPNRITATDLVAVSMLGVEVPADAALMVLEQKKVTITELLSGIPSSPMHLTDESVYGKGQPAWRLWDLLREEKLGLGPTKTSKILARKRPHTIPVQDSRVLSRLEIRGGYWSYLWHWLREEQRRPAMLEQLRSEVGGIDDISLLRVLDVSLWRYDRDQVVPVLP